MKKSLGILSIFFILIISLLLFFVLSYRERPSNINKELWSYGKKVTKSLNNSIEDLAKTNISDDSVFLNNSNKAKFFLIKDEQKFRKLIFRQGKDLVDEGKVVTSEEKTLYKAVIDYYIQMEKVDELINEHDGVALKNLAEENKDNTTGVAKKTEIINELVVLNNYNKAIKNIYGYDEESKINKIIKKLKAFKS